MPALVDAYNDYSRWDELRDILISLIPGCAPGTPAPSRQHPYLVSIIADGVAYSLIVPQKEKYSPNLQGVSQVYVALLIDNLQKPDAKPSDFKLTSVRTPNPLAAQLPDLAKVLGGAIAGGVPALNRLEFMISESLGQPADQPKPGTWLYASDALVSLPFKNAAITETGTVDSDDADQKVKLSASYTNKENTVAEFTAVAGAIILDVKGAERMKVDSGKYASDPMTRAVTMAAIAIHPWKYDSTRSSMSWPERVSVFGGGVLTPAPGVGVGASFGIVRGFGVDFGWLNVWVPTAKGGAQPGADAPTGEKQLVYSRNYGWFVGGNYVFKSGS